jgi:hypothetical protein
MQPTPKNHQTNESFLQEVYQEHQALYSAQTPQVQRFIDAQARLLAEALVQRLDQVHFLLPDSVLVEQQLFNIPPKWREQLAISRANHLGRMGLREALHQSLSQLEHVPDPGLSAASRLMRHATARHLVYGILPSGRKVQYITAAGEEIPTIPMAVPAIGEPAFVKSALLAGTDAVAEDGSSENGAPGNGRGELQVPYAPAARLFYLPQWVAFDDQGTLLLNSLEEAEACLASMQRFMQALHDAIALTPYIVADPVYQQKRYGMLGQLINQGRALAFYQARQIIAEIQRRVSGHDLNRGLCLSLPYFDDQDLKLNVREIGVIPGGRIMFLPAFVVMSMQEEKTMGAQDTRLNPSTRKHLLCELNAIEQAFRE